MSVHLERQIDKLKKMILTLGTMVEDSVEGAIRAVETRDEQLAKQVVDGDIKIDLMEIEIEEECMHTLALHQPVAHDLRYIVAVLKINNELERIADLATSIAEQVEFLDEKTPQMAVSYDLPQMASTVRSMLRQSLDSLVNIDPDLAKSVRSMDDQVDDVNRQMYLEVEQALQDHAADVKRLIHLLNITRRLERIADHTVNIAEDVVYMALGEMHRHRKALALRKADDTTAAKP